MKASDLREKSVEDLRELQASLASATFQNRLKNFTNRLDDTSQIGKTKRDLARVYTLLRERNEAPAAPVAAKPVKAEAPTVKAEAPKAEAPAAPSAEAATAKSSAPAAAPKKKSAKKSEAK
jgi:large subunit ribosomal protein L29